MIKNTLFGLDIGRRLKHAAAMIFACLLFAPSFAHAVSCDFKNGEVSNSICGYVEAGNAYTGGSLKVHVSSLTSAFQVDLRRVGTDSVSKSQSFTGASNHVTPVNGGNLNWGNAYNISIPSDWKSGLYSLTFSNSAGTHTEYLTIRQGQAGSRAKVLVLNGDTTKLAYSPIGGKSLYEYNSTGGQPATNVSLDRPVGVGTWTEYNQFITWLEQNSIAYESASMTDLHRNPGLLGNYNLVLIPDHNEYWTKEMRDAWDKYLAEGGNAAIFSGNTMWWQIRLNGSQMICYKNAAKDPLYGVDNSRVTVKWYSEPVNQPENTSIGVSFRHAGYHNFETYYLVGANATNGKYQVTDASHWAFAGTSLSNGAYFGNAIVGYETDGALFNMVAGKPVVTGLDGTPTNFRILGLAPAYAYNAPSFIGDYVPGNYQEHGWSTMGIFQPVLGGGTVFVAPTIGWPHGLADSKVSKITLNVINKLKVRTIGNSNTGNTGNTGNTSTTSGSGGGGSLTGWVIWYGLLVVGLVVYRRHRSMGNGAIA